MKERFRNKLENAPVKRFVRKVLHKVHRRFHEFFYYDESLFLKDLDRHKRWEIGEYTYGHPSKSPRIVHFGEDCSLKIGNYCSFAEDVWIVFGGFHRTDWITTYPFSVLFDGAENIEGLPHAKGDIVIGNDVWVCTGAMIMSGVTVGNGAVIAARSVVTKNVPPYTIVAGNPAVPVKKRFPDEIIEELEHIQWWNWPIDKIQEELPTLLSPDVQRFLSKHSAAMDLEEILR